MNFDRLEKETNAEPNHWSERGRATSLANADALGRPRRSVLPLGGNEAHAFIKSIELIKVPNLIL